MVQQPMINTEGMRRYLSADGLPLDRRCRDEGPRHRSHDRGGCGVSESRDPGDGTRAPARRPTTDKRSRLQTVAPLIKNGTLLFPRTGCEDLLGQVFNLGIESHDDLCDGLTNLLQGFIEQGLELAKIHWIEM